MSKFDNLWNGQPSMEVPERITFETQVVPALGQLKAYLHHKYQSKYIEILDYSQNLGDVDSSEKQKQAVSLAGKTTKLFKEMEEERKYITSPLLKFKTGVDNNFKDYTDNLKNLRKEVDGKLATYEARIEMERRQAEKAAQEETKRLQAVLDKEAKKKGIEAPQVVVPVVPPIPTTTRTEDGTASVVKKWKGHIINPELVPRAYCEPSQRLIDQAVRAGVREIPGCEVREESEIRMRL